MGEHRGRRPFIALAVPVLSSMRLPLRGLAGRWWEWAAGLEAGATQTRCDVEAGTELGGTRRTGTELVRSGGGGFLVLIWLDFVVGYKHPIAAGFPKTPPQKTKPSSLCVVQTPSRAGASASWALAMRAFLFAPSKQRRSCGSVGGQNPSMRLVKRRGKLDKSMPKLEAQEIEHRASTQPDDNPASCRNLGRALICCWRLEESRFRKETRSGQPSVRLLSSHPRNWDILLTSSPFTSSNDPINNTFGAVNDVSNPPSGRATVSPGCQHVNRRCDP